MKHVLRIEPNLYKLTIIPNINPNGTYVMICTVENGTSDETIDAAALKEAFKTMADDEGRITGKRLRSFIQQQGFDFTEDEVKEMLDIADPKGTGEVSFKGMFETRGILIEINRVCKHCVNITNIALVSPSDIDC